MIIVTTSMIIYHSIFFFMSTIEEKGREIQDLNYEKDSLLLYTGNH